MENTTNVNAVATFSFDPLINSLAYSIDIQGLNITDIDGVHIHQISTGAKALGIVNPDQDLDDRTITANVDGSINISGVWEVSDSEAGIAITDFAQEFNQKDTTQEFVDLLVKIHTTPNSGLNNLEGVIQGSGTENTFIADLQPLAMDMSNAQMDGHTSHTHSSIDGFGDPSLVGDYLNPSFSNFDRYNENASYNKAPYYEFPRNIGLPLTRNLEFDNFIKAMSGNNPLNLPDGGDLPFYTGLPTLDSPNSYQWDSFPAGEAQQFLIVSVDIDKINVENTPLTGDDDSPVELDAISTSTLDRPFTLSTTVTPFNAGPIPHIHWAEDEWFVLLQGEIDSWVMSPSQDAYDLYEFPADENGEPLIPPEYDGPPALAKDKVQDFYYAHLTPGQAVYLPRGYAHSYRNISPTGEPLVFLTIWSRDIENGYPEGGIEEFFTLPEPRIGRFYDTSEDAAQYGSFYNKTLGSEDSTSNQQRFVDYKNTFPDYYVVMSGNYGDFLVDGGNWNPSIYKDYEALPISPPDYWNPSLEKPWLTDASDPDAQEYYPGPAPNSPSSTVSFNIPFDPQVLNRIYITLNDANNAEQLAALLGSYSESTQNYTGNIYSSYYQDPNNPNNYFIVEYWDEYSALDDFNKTNAYNTFVTQVEAIGGTLNTEIATINPDKSLGGPSDPTNITLVGRFQAKPGTREEMIDILTSLQNSTRQEEGNIAFEFYESSSITDQWVVFEQYDNGDAITEHFSQAYTKEFFSEFGLLLVGNGVADGSAVTYITDEPSSSFYEIQKQGLDTLTKLLTSSPELTVELNALPQGILEVKNGTNTAGIGIVLSFYADASTDQITEYGIFTVDDNNGSINGFAPGSANYLDQVKSRAISLFSTNADDLYQMEIDRNIFVETNQQYAFYQASNGSIFQNNSEVVLSIGNPDFFTAADSLDIEYSFGDGSLVSAGLNGPIKGLESIISEPQVEGLNILDTSSLVNKTLISQVDVYSDSENRPLSFGLYTIADFSGAIVSPQGGQLILPDDPLYKTTIFSDDFEKISFNLSNFSNNTSETNFESSLSGGGIYAPYITVDQDGEEFTYFAFEEANPDSLSHIISLGENNFAFEDSFQGGDQDFNDLVLSLNFQFDGPIKAISTTSRDISPEKNNITEIVTKFSDPNNDGFGELNYDLSSTTRDVQTQAEDSAFQQTEAAFHNIVGLYRVANSSGAIQATTDINGDGVVNGQDLLNPGDTGYATAALLNRVENFNLQLGAGGDAARNTDAAEFGDVLLEGGLMYAPFIIANGGNLIPTNGTISEGVDAFLEKNPTNTAANIVNYWTHEVAYFSFAAANPDGAEHLQNRGNNIFGFEDLPGDLGVSDFDFDDAVFQFQFFA